MPIPKRGGICFRMMMCRGLWVWPAVGSLPFPKVKFAQDLSRVMSDFNGGYGKRHWMTVIVGGCWSICGISYWSATVVVSILYGPAGGGPAHVCSCPDLETCYSNLEHRRLEFSSEMPTAGFVGSQESQTHNRTKWLCNGPPLRSRSPLVVASARGW